MDWAAATSLGAAGGVVIEVVGVLGSLTDWRRARFDAKAAGRVLHTISPAFRRRRLPRFFGHPLIDPRAGAPFSNATPEAIEAIIRHPQGALRCYQRVTIAGHGQAVTDADGGPRVPAVVRDTALSAFIYLAVEGQMLYVQFVATALPPIQRRFRLVIRPGDLGDWFAWLPAIQAAVCYLRVPWVWDIPIGRVAAA
jgi:hypothetical protein